MHHGSGFKRRGMLPYFPLAETFSSGFVSLQNVFIKSAVSLQKSLQKTKRRLSGVAENSEPLPINVPWLLNNLLINVINRL